MGVGFKCPVCRNTFKLTSCPNCRRDKWVPLYPHSNVKEGVCGAECKFCGEREYPPIRCPNCNTNIHQKFWFNTGCFIATAVYNDYDHPIVKDLRLVRDNWLVKRAWGRGFIEFYYRYSPLLAKHISQNRFLRLLFLFCLIKPFHFIVKSLDLSKLKV